MEMGGDGTAWDDFLHMPVAEIALILLSAVFTVAVIWLWALEARDRRKGR